MRTATPADDKREVMTPRSSDHASRAQVFRSWGFLTGEPTKGESMLLTRGADPWERGTRRLILDVAMFDRLMHEPRTRRRDALEKKLGRETVGLALAAAGVRRASSPRSAGVA
jgi:hypothetical protein